MGESVELIHLGARVPVWMSNEISKISNTLGIDKSDVIRDALKSYIEAVNAHSCPNCGVVNDSDAKFCKACGHGLDGESQKELENLLKDISNDPKKLAILLRNARELKE